MIWGSKEILTKEDFQKFPHIWGNIWNYFSPVSETNFDGYRKQPFYKRFVAENKILNIVLQRAHSNRHNGHHLDLVYEAYTIMMGYEDVGSNYILLH